MKLAKRLAAVNFIREVIDADTRQQLGLESLITGVEARTRRIPFRHANGGIEHIYSQRSEKTKRDLGEGPAVTKAAVAAAAASEQNEKEAAAIKAEEAAKKEKEEAAMKAMGTTCVERDSKC